MNRTQRSKYLLCLGVSICAAVITYWPDGLTLFRYDRDAILAGQGWRLVSAHLVHLNTAHLFLNLLGLFLLSELLWGDFPTAHGVALLGVAGSGISALLWLLHPELLWYAGLSGILHALWSACAWAGLARTSADDVRSRTVCAHGMALLIVKLAAEWRYGASVSTEQLIGAPVIVPAHFYGAVIGMIYILSRQLFGRIRLKINS